MDLLSNVKMCTPYNSDYQIPLSVQFPVITMNSFAEECVGVGSALPIYYGTFMSYIVE